MSGHFRNLISSKCRSALSSLNLSSSLPSQRNLISRMKLVSCQSETQPFKFNLPIASLPFDDPNQTNRFISTFETDTTIPFVKWEPSGDQLSFGVDRDPFLTRELANHLRHDRKGYKWLRDGLFPEDAPLNVIVEFSSPNVAKPFHMGHLRSTIVGNFVSNIYESVGHNVTRINYLGDWGTQFGLLAVGLQTSGQNLDDILKSEKPIQKLYEVYVEANKKSKEDPSSFGRLAQDQFSRLESSDPHLMRDWKLIRDLTVNQLERVYKRLGVTFHHYQGESMYGSEKSEGVVRLMKDKGLLERDKDGRQVVAVGEEGHQVAIIKSDGATLYVTRDIAAAIDRKATFGFDRMLYVVETGQSDHFRNLFGILSRCGFEWSHSLEHVNFGRIQGMSTRKGTAVFLSDILDEGRDQMLERLSESANTRTLNEENRFEVSDILATTAVTINDLKQRRTKNYVFSWEHALHSKGDSGIKLQYSHARLTSLINKQLTPGTDLESLLLENQNLVSHLKEPEAVALVFHMSRYSEVLRDSYVALEPSYMVLYLFRLCNLASKAIKLMPVKGQELEVAQARLAMFASTRAVLRQGLKVLGVTPLDQI